MTPLTIYDAVQVSALPSGGAYLGYVDGGYVTYPLVREMYPTALILPITVAGEVAAKICDVEGGDATPEIAAEGVRRGLYDTIYCNLSTQPLVAAACQGLDWNWYAADPTGWPHIVVGSVATQWGWPGIGSPGNYDISWTDGVWPGVTPPKAQVLPDDMIGDLLGMPTTDPQFVVRKLYLDILLREPDPEGFKHDVDYLVAGGTLNQLLSNLQDSPEGQSVLAKKRAAIGL